MANHRQAPYRPKLAQPNAVVGRKVPGCTVYIKEYMNFVHSYYRRTTTVTDIGQRVAFDTRIRIYFALKKAARVDQDWVDNIPEHIIRVRTHWHA